MVDMGVDWVIHQLTDDVINYYGYYHFRKEHGLQEGRALTISAIVQARKIPDDCVQLPVPKGDLALVHSASRPHLV